MTIEPNEKQSQDKNPFSKFHPITKRIITTIDLIIVFVFIYLSKTPTSNNLTSSFVRCFL